MRTRQQLRWLSGLAMVAALLALWPGLASAQQAHLEMDVTALHVGETAALRLVVTGGMADAHPELPPSESLRFSVQRPMRERRSVNFQTTDITTYNWAVTAVQSGSAVVGPLELRVGGKRVKVRALGLEVREPEPGDSGPNMLEASIEPSPDGWTADQVVPLWQGQVLVYRFAFSHRDPLYDARWTQPEFEGLEAVPGVDQDQKEYALERDGHSYTVHDISVPLQASAAGAFEIAPSVIKAQFPVERSRRSRRHDPFEDFFGGSVFAETRSEVLASNPVSVQIRPLPDQDRPASFDGLVGSFQLRAELANERVRAGDSVTLTLTVRGDGRLEGLRLPAMEETEALRAYDDEPEVQEGLVGGRYRAKGVLRRALVPMTEGSLSLPPVELSWFDPAQGEYVEWSSPPLVLEVLPGEGGEAQVLDFDGPRASAQEAVRSLGEDILPIHADVDVGDRRFSPWRPVPLLLVLLPGFVLLGQMVTDLRLRGGRRSARIKAIRQRLAELPSDRAERLAVLEASFREAAGLALGCPPAGVDADRLRRGLEEPLGSVAAALYARLERARYGGGSGELEASVSELVGKLLEVAK